MARFLHMTDLHVVRDAALASGVLDTREILRMAVDRLIGMGAALAPLDALLVSGDISDDGSADSYALARSELARLGLPILVVPGNHDAREPLRQAFSDLETMPEQGLIDWTTSISDTLVIGLDTLVEGQGGGVLRDESLDFLRNTLATQEAKQVIVMLHHPPIRTGIRFMDAIGLKNAHALEAVLNDAKSSVTVLAGHVHGVHHGRLGKHHVATAPAVCSAFAMDRRADAPIGFFLGPTGCAIVDTGPNGIWSALSLEAADGPFPF